MVAVCFALVALEISSNQIILHFFGAYQTCDFFQFFFTFPEAFLHRNKALQKNEVGYEQDLSMLFSKQPYFLLPYYS
jgi:hypothetical protein